MNYELESMAANAICHAASMVQASIQEAASFYTLPHVVYKPKLFKDGNQWCALLGDNLQEGVCGFGDTPADAMWRFDAAWSKAMSNQRLKELNDFLRDELAKPEPTQPVQPECWCTRCDLEVNTFRSHMAICPLCGDKRCPRAKDHRDDCTKKSTYDQTALELREICGWKTLIPGEGCLNCQRKAVQPAWHDAPNAPGDWVIVGKGFKSELQTGITQQEIDRVSSWPGRWFGPIPEDTK